MIKAIERLDKIAAVGVLARAALSLGYADSPSVDGVANESQLRAAVIEEVRARLGVAKEDLSPDAIDRLAQMLDAESDELLAPLDAKAALARLAERGDLPSDLYEIYVIPSIPEIFGSRFLLEKDIIDTTIRAPTVEQHFGPDRGADEPAMISLFLRNFQTRWPIKDFFMLVAAQRDGLRLSVHQAWRIYPFIVNVSGLKTPVDWLRRFSDAYGADIEVDGNKAHFFMFANGNVPAGLKLGRSQHKKVLISRFAVRDNFKGVDKAALVVAIDIRKYLQTIDDYGVRREDILDGFVPAPQPRD